MKDEVKNILKVSSVYLATIIGAGFASGQEIIHFFTQYGRGGIYGIILSGILFAVSGYIIMEKVYMGRVRNFEELIFPMTGLIFGRIVELISTLFLFLVYCVMIAGMGSTLSELVKLPLLYNNIIISIISMIIILVGVEGVARLSTLLAPALIIGIVGVGLFIIIIRDKEVFKLLKTIDIAATIDVVTNNWIVSSLLYVSYNNILSTAVLSNLLPYLKTRRIAVIGGFLGGFLLFFSAMVLNIALTPFCSDALMGEFPVIEIVQLYSGSLKSAYKIILIFAMLTSAVASGYSAIYRISTWLKIKTKTATVIICTMAVPLSSLGFSRLISTVYPIFGYTGLFILILLIIDWVKSIKINLKS